MTLRDADYAALFGAIYLDSSGPAAWNRALTTLRDPVGAEFGFLIGHEVIDSPRTLIATTGADERRLAGHTDCWDRMARNSNGSKDHRAIRTRRIVSSTLHCPLCDGPSAVDATPGFYRAGGMFGVGTDRIVSYCLKRAAERGPFRKHDLALIESVVPHLQRAMEMREQQLAGERSTKDMIDALQTNRWGIAAINIDHPRPRQADLCQIGHQPAG